MLAEQRAGASGTGAGSGSGGAILAPSLLSFPGPVSKPPARPRSRRAAAVRSPARTAPGLFAWPQLIYGPCSFDVKAGAGRRAQHPLASTLIIF